MLLFCVIYLSISLIECGMRSILLYISLTAAYIRVMRNCNNRFQKIYLVRLILRSVIVLPQCQNRDNAGNWMCHADSYDLLRQYASGLKEVRNTCIRNTNAAYIVLIHLLPAYKPTCVGYSKNSCLEKRRYMLCFI